MPQINFLPKMRSYLITTTKQGRRHIRASKCVHRTDCSRRQETIREGNSKYKAFPED